MLTHLTPMLGVTDVQASLDFYADALGFSESGRFEHDGTLYWAHICSGKSDLMLTRMEDMESGTAGRKQLILYFYLDDVVALHTSLQKKGYRVTGLRVTFYQMKEFELEDPDGYQLWFGQDTDEPPDCE